MGTVHPRYSISTAAAGFTELEPPVIRISTREVEICGISPNINAHAARFVRTAREALDQHIFFGERHLRYVLSETMRHYLEERHHQGLGGKLIRPVVSNDNLNLNGRIECRERLGGLLRFYSRRAA